MSFSRTFLRTKVARRTLGLFLLTAALPVATLTFISYRQVTEQLDEQSRSRLRQSAKITGIGILERLDLLRADLQIVTAALETPSGGSATLQELTTSLESHFRALALSRPGSLPVRISGEMAEPAWPDAGEIEHLRSGRSLLRVDQDSGPPAILMGRPFDERNLNRGMVWGEIDPLFLWDAGSDGTLPRGITMCVLTEANERLHCPRPIPAAALADLAPILTSASSARLEWTDGEESFLVGYWSMFLGLEYAAPPWTVVLSESKSTVLAPLADFNRTLFLVGILALGVVFLFTNTETRKHLEPLEELKRGTLRIAERDFSQPVKVATADEFEDLAHAFNNMSHSLARQFDTLAAIGDIDRAVLSVLERERVVDTVLRRAREAVGCDGVSLCLFRPAGRDEVGTVSSLWIEGAGKVSETSLSPSDIAEFTSHPRTLILDGEAARRTYLDLGDHLEIEPQRVVLLPLWTQTDVTGVLALYYTQYRNRSRPNEPSLDARLSDDVTQARQLADQIAVAMSNTQLVEDLEDLSWGALKALARAVDAKSAWTSGHSERVTSLALEIGQALGLSESEIEALHRGGLLHDIGKIGVPAAILDKKERLTDTEHAKMREHTWIGARILEPITAFAQALPIVLHHHERFDGDGYPDGLRGEEIPLLARVLAVPDMFDALTSARPYRDAIPASEALEIIRGDSGTHFDPAVVDAFLAITERREEEAETRPTIERASA